MKCFKWLLLLSLIISACERVYFNGYSEPMDIPSNDSIDVDNDSIVDFVLDYFDFRMLSGPSNDDLIISSIYPLAGNELLSGLRGDILFLEQNDTIRYNDSTKIMWSQLPLTIMHIGADDGKWEKNWTLLSPSSSYYIGMKKNINETVIVGWILLDINTRNGEISVLDSEFSTSSEIVI